MPPQNWTLTDVEKNGYIDNLSLVRELERGAARSCRVWKRRLQGGLRDGVDLVEIGNARIRLAVVPTRGMGIWKLSDRGTDLGWQAPIKGPVHPALVPLWEPSGIGWLSGFDEFLCRCGLESNGAPEFDDRGRLKYPLHGKIANVPAEKVELSIDHENGEITLTGEVEERRLFGNSLRLRSTIQLRVDQPGFRLIDEVINPSDSPAQMELLYHINLGPPLLGEGATVVVPVQTLVPRNSRAAEGVATWDRYGPPQPGFAEQVYLMDLLADAAGNTQVLLKSSHGERGLSLKYNVQQLPKFTLWKNTGALSEGYVTGLEPGINFPNPRSFEQAQGRVWTVAPGEQKTFAIEFVTHADAQSVAVAEEAVRKLQTSKPTIHTQPLSGWTAG